MSVQFIVHGIPQPAGSKRGFVVNGRAVITDANAKSRPWKAQVADAAAQAMYGYELVRGRPVVLRLDFYLPRPKGHFGKRGLLPSAPIAPIVKPDLLKLARAVEDACTGIVWHDDAQIVREIMDKHYGEPARIEVAVSLLDEKGFAGGRWPQLERAADGKAAA